MGRRIYFNMHFVVHTLAESALSLLCALAPVVVLVLVVGASANGTRVRLTAVAQRMVPLRALLWLGVAIHECGHVMACLATLTRVRQVRVQWHSGFVKHDRRGWLAAAVISCGPLLSATALALVVATFLLGQSFTAAAAPFRDPLAADLSNWVRQAATSVANVLAGMVSRQGWWHLPLLLLLAGMLSSAVPSPPDMRNAGPGIFLAAFIALLAEAASRYFFAHSLIADARAPIGAVCGALGLAAFACLLGWVLVLLLSLPLARRS